MPPITQTPADFKPMSPVGKITWERSSSFKDPILAVFFLRAIRNDIDQLNQTIESYNSTNDIQEKRRLMEHIYWQTRNLQDTYPGDIMTGFADYQTEILHNLFVDLQSHKERLNKLSPPVDILSKPASLDTEVSPVEMLERMVPNKVSALLAILSAGENCDLNTLNELYSFQNLDDELEELHAFEGFLSKNTIGFLGGGNAQNFKVTQNADPSQVFVLKVEERLNMPKRIERYLRATVLRDVLAPIYAERQAKFMRAARPPHYPATETTCSLLLTAYCPGGNLEKHSDNQMYRDRLHNGLNLYSQMGDVLTRISSQNCAFPDIKNTNWLVDEHGKLRLADTKSFVMTDGNGYVNTENLKENGYGFITTRYMNPPEFYQTRVFSADKMHVYMLGKNLYQYLSNCDASMLKKPPSSFDYSSPIFLAPEGIVLKKLISEMLEDLPANRLSMSEALAQLDQIKALSDVKQSCYTLLDELAAITNNDQIPMSRMVIQNKSDIQSVLVLKNLFIDMLIVARKEQALIPSAPPAPIDTVVKNTQPINTVNITHQCKAAIASDKGSDEPNTPSVRRLSPQADTTHQYKVALEQRSADKPDDGSAIENPMHKNVPGSAG